MATIPRYQTLGVQYADLPRLSTAGLEQTAKGYDVLADKLDRMSAYFQERATTEVQKQARQYAIDYPPTKEQLDVAAGTKLPFEIPGAGRVFQETYNKSAAEMLSAELQINISTHASSFKERLEKGETIHPSVIRSQMGDIIDGYTSLVSTLSPDLAVKFRAANATSAHDIYSQGLKAYEKRRTAQAATELLNSVDKQRPIVRAILENADEIAPDTGKPVDTESKLNILKDVYLTYAGEFGDAAYKAFVKMVDEEKVSSLVNIAASKEFATDDNARIAKVQSGDFGAYSNIYKSLSPGDQENISDKLNKRLEALAKARTATLNQATDAGNVILRQIYLSNNVTEQRILFKALDGLPIDPSVIRSASTHIRTHSEAGAKADDMNVLYRLTNAVEGETATVEMINDEVAAGKLTTATAKTLIQKIADPDSALGRGLKLLARESVIEEKGMPSILTNDEKKAGVMLALKAAEQDLADFARTPNDKGLLPTHSDITKRAKELSQNLKEATLPMLEDAANQVRNQILVIIPELANVKLEDDTAVEAVFAEFTKKNPKLSQSIISAKRYISNYKQLQTKIGKK